MEFSKILNVLIADLDIKILLNSLHIMYVHTSRTV